MRQVQKKAGASEAKLKAALKDVETLSELNKSLIQNQREYTAQRDAAVQARRAQEEEVTVRPSAMLLSIAS